MIRATRRPVTAVLLTVLLLLAVFVLLAKPRSAAIYRESAPWAGGGQTGDAQADATAAADTAAIKTNEDVELRDALNKPFNFRIEDADPEIIDPIVTRTFYMLKTGAEVMWSRLPIHFETTLRRFPYHEIYSDGSGTVSGKDIIDVMHWLPEDVKSHDDLTAWRIRQEAGEQNWGWDAKTVTVPEEVGGWATDKYKNVPILAHAYQKAPPSIDWFVMVDDDTYILTESFAALVRDKDPKEPWYFGSRAVTADNTMFAHGGSGIVMSRGAVEALFKDKDPQPVIDKYSRFAVSICCGDMALAYALMGVGVPLNLPAKDEEFDPFQGNSLVNTRMIAGAWCQRLISYHHLYPWEIQIMFDRENYRHHHRSLEQRRGGDLYKDFYHDFVLPYLQPEKQNWSIYAEGRTLTGEMEIDIGETKGTLMPHLDKYDCIRACDADTQCFGWEWFQNTKCVLETRGIIRGEALNQYSSNWNDASVPVTSGWMVDRIRRSRAAAPCDPLEYDEATGQYNDNDETSEGWYFRLKKKQKDDSSIILASAAHAAAEGLVVDAVPSGVSTGVPRK